MKQFQVIDDMKQKYLLWCFTNISFAYRDIFQMLIAKNFSYYFYGNFFLINIKNTNRLEYMNTLRSNYRIC